MKKIIFITLVLIAATAYITIKYFKNLNTTGIHAANILSTIPNNALLVLQFTNEKGFYDIFTNNKLIGNLIGEKKISELDTVRKLLFGKLISGQPFNESNIFISIHPLHTNDTELLLTAAASKEFDIEALGRLATLQKTGLVITPFKINEKKGYTIYISTLKKRFYIINQEENLFSASFSKELLTQSAIYKANKNKPSYLLLPDQQNSNSLATLYINYTQLTPLFSQFFKNKDHDIFKGFRMFPALAALNLNYKTDALMFNGYTHIVPNSQENYLSLFTSQQPVINSLKEIFPSTTAYSLNMAVSDPQKFTSGLSQLNNKAGLKNEGGLLFNKIKTETGINLKTEFDQQLGNEFAVISTRFQEKIALIMIRDGSKLKPVMANISNMLTDDEGQFKYSKLPFFLLGDVFNGFRQPYFKIIDNYLILANSHKELESYTNTYINRKFLNNVDQYNQFDNLLAERSNVAFFIHFKNAQQILKTGLKNEYYELYNRNSLSWKNFYAASYQFTAADKNFYTNFCMLQNSGRSDLSKDNKSQ